MSTMLTLIHCPSTHDQASYCSCLSPVPRWAVVYWSHPSDGHQGRTQPDRSPSEGRSASRYPWKSFSWEVKEINVEIQWIIGRWQSIVSYLQYTQGLVYRPSNRWPAKEVLQSTEVTSELFSQDLRCSFQGCGYIFGKTSRLNWAFF